MNPGFEKADSANLPTVTMDMVYEYLISNADYFSAEVKNVKLQRSAKEHYGDNAVNYVQLKRAGMQCTVQCKITPEHKIHKKAYSVVAVVDEKNQKVLNCKCTDCAASAGGCKHAVAFLFWLHRRSEEPSTTSKECYWKGSVLSKVGRQESFMSLKKIAGKDEDSLGPRNENMAITLLNTCENRRGGIFDLYFDPPLKKADIFHLVIQYKKSAPAQNSNADHFIDFVKDSWELYDLQSVERATRMQAECSEWFCMRFGRITASILYEAARCKTSGYLLEKIMGGSPPLHSEAVLRGKRLEKEVLRQVEKLKKIHIVSSGIILNKKYPIFGASPDGITSDYVIEVKCPSKAETIKNYIVGDSIEKKYYFQLQLNMFFSNKKKGLFCIASPNFEQDQIVSIHEVSLDVEKIEDIIGKAFDFWKCIIFPELIKINS